MKKLWVVLWLVVACNKKHDDRLPDPQGSGSSFGAGSAWDRKDWVTPTIHEVAGTNIASRMVGETVYFYRPGGGSGDIDYVECKGGPGHCIGKHGRCPPCEASPPPNCPCRNKKACEDRCCEPDDHTQLLLKRHFKLEPAGIESAPGSGSGSGLGTELGSGVR